MGIQYKSDSERADRATPTVKPDDNAAVIAEVAAVTADALATLSVIDDLTKRGRDTTAFRGILRDDLARLQALTNGPSLMRPTPTGTTNE